MIKIFSLLKGAIVVIFVSFGKVQTAIFFDKINFENFLLIKVYIQNIKNWERASNIQELWVCLLYMAAVATVVFIYCAVVLGILDYSGIVSYFVKKN